MTDTTYPVYKMAIDGATVVKFIGPNRGHHVDFEQERPENMFGPEREFAELYFRELDPTDPIMSFFIATLRLLDEIDVMIDHKPPSLN